MGKLRGYMQGVRRRGAPAGAGQRDAAAAAAGVHTNLRNVGLNLNRSWGKAHSHAYNTPFLSESSTKDLSLPTLEIVSQRTHPGLFRTGRTSQPYDVGPPEGGLSLFASHREGRRHRRFPAWILT